MSNNGNTSYPCADCGRWALVTFVLTITENGKVVEHRVVCSTCWKARR